MKREKWLRAELTIQGWAGAQLSLLGTNGVDTLGRRTHNSLFEIAKGKEWRKGWERGRKAEAANTPPTKQQAMEEKAEAANTPPTEPQAGEERAEEAKTPPTEPQAGEEEKTQAEEGKKGAPELSKWKKMLEELWVFLAKMTNPETH